MRRTKTWALQTDLTWKNSGESNAYYLKAFISFHNRLSASSSKGLGKSRFNEFLEKTKISPVDFSLKTLEGSARGSPSLTGLFHVRFRQTFRAKTALFHRPTQKKSNYFAV